MGSFNTTCFASQQTIAPNDYAVILPIIQQTTYEPVEIVAADGSGEVKHGYSNSTCYPTAFWGFGGPLINGEYDDYGQFKLIDSPSNKINICSFFNKLHNKIYDVKQGENEYHEHPLEFRTLYEPKKNYTFDELENIWEKLWEVGQESRLFVKDWNQNAVSLSFAVMHKATAEYLIEHVENKKSWSGESLEQSSYFHNYVNNRVKEIRKAFSSKSLEDALFFICSKIANLEGIRIGEQEGTHISLFYNNFDNVINIFEDYFKKNPKTEEITKTVSDDILKVLKDQLDHRYIVNALTELNIKLSPMVYAPQDYSNEIGNDYLKMVREVNERVNKIVKEKYGEELADEEEIISSSIKPKMK